MSTSIPAGILALAVAAQCFGQPIKVAQGSNPADGSAWVTLTIPSQTSYQMANGSGKFAPSLTVRCDSQGKPGKERRSFSVLLDTGGVQPGALSVSGSGSDLLTGANENSVRLLRENVLFRMKLDANKPQQRRWELVPKSDTVYEYWGDGATGVGAILSPGQFLSKIFAARVLTIEFQPFGHQTFGQDNSFASEFHPAGLEDEFKRHRECSLK
jgi:hypothetical protein